MLRNPLFPALDSVQDPCWTFSTMQFLFSRVQCRRTIATSMANIQTNSLISLTNLDNDCQDQPCYVYRIESPSFPMYSIGKKEIPRRYFSKTANCRKDSGNSSSSS